MRYFLVTGGSGFIGSNFIHNTLSNTTDIHITNLDALTYAGNPENLFDLELDPRYKFFHGSINNSLLLNDIFQETPIDTIIHFAAESHVDRSITDPLLFIQTNVLGTANLLLHAKKYWTGLDSQRKSSFRFLHISTDEVFGTLKIEEPAFTENTPYAPNSPYAASKASSDHLVRSYFHTYGFPVIITNCSNNYGSYQYPEKLIPLVISNAVNGKSLPIYGDGYNIGGNNQPTNLEVVQMICKILDEFLPRSKFIPHANLIEFVKDRLGHDRRYAMNTTKIRQELGWQAKESLESGLHKTIRWYLDNKDWVNTTLGKEAHKNWLTQNYEGREEEDK
jgi:dTDP-glucose 4,6-dehydratase